MNLEILLAKTVDKVWVRLIHYLPTTIGQLEVAAQTT